MAVELDEKEQRVLRQKARAAVLDAVRSLGGQAERGALVERALEIGDFTERELAAPSPNAKHTRRIDHELAWAPTNLKKKGLLLNPRWGLWALPPAIDEPPVAAPVLRDRLTELRDMSYREYLRTPEWRETRNAALARAENHCQFNAAHEGDLHVHHNSYDRLGEERMADLLVLCETCHGRHHEIDGRPRRAAARPVSVPPPSFSAGMVPPAPPAPAKRSLLNRLLSR